MTDMSELERRLSELGDRQDDDLDEPTSLPLAIAKLNKEEEEN